MEGEDPDYPFTEFLSDFEACNFSAPTLAETMSEEFVTWFGDFIYGLYPDKKVARYRGGTLVAAYGHVRGLIDFYTYEGLARRMPSGGFIASTELVASMYELIAGPEELPGMPDRHLVASNAKALRKSWAD